MLLSIVSPVYRGEKMLDELVSRIRLALDSLSCDFEIILVNDASPDDSWRKIEQCCKGDERVKGVNLSRNFGQHYAITAGLSIAKGDAIVVMDCDLQDQPEEIPRLLAEMQKGYDTVFAQRVDRKDSFFKKLGSKAFYALFSYLTDTKQDASVANFGIYSRSVVDAILSMGDATRFLPTMVQWVGFKQAYLPVEHSLRAEGTSSYSLARLLSLAFDNIISFSDKPLRLMIKFGCVVILLSLFITCYYIFKYYYLSCVVSGFTAVILSIWFSTGFLITLIGLVGIYIGRIFNTVKQRPTFIVEKTINL